MRRRCGGNMVLEAALWIPILVLLVVGMIQFGKITYTYYSLKKAVYSAARYIALQQGTNFCDPANDPNVQTALQFATTDLNTGLPLITGLTPDMFSVTTECLDPISGTLGVCTNPGCGTAAGSQRPDYVVVNIPGGYLVRPRIPFVTLDPIPLKPSVIVPFGGSAL